jgi:hypothetical protein
MRSVQAPHQPHPVTNVLPVAANRACHGQLEKTAKIKRLEARLALIADESGSTGIIRGYSPIFSE